MTTTTCPSTATFRDALHRCELSPHPTRTRHHARADDQVITWETHEATNPDATPVMVVSREFDWRNTALERLGFIALSCGAATAVLLLPDALSDVLPPVTLDGVALSLTETLRPLSWFFAPAAFAVGLLKAGVRWERMRPQVGAVAAI